MLLFLILFNSLLFSNSLEKDILGVWEIKEQKIFLNSNLDSILDVNSEENSNLLDEFYLMEFLEDGTMIKLLKDGSKSNLKYEINGDKLTLIMPKSKLELIVDYQGRYTYLYYKIDYNGDGVKDFVVEKLQRNYSTGNWTMSMMNKYNFVLLLKGENRSQNEEEAMKIQEAHLKNIADMAEAGILYIAGPFLIDGDERGILIFKDVEISLIEEWLNKDPAIQKKRLKYKLIPWMTEGGATLPVE